MGCSRIYVTLGEQAMNQGEPVVTSPRRPRRVSGIIQMNAHRMGGRYRSSQNHAVITLVQLLVSTKGVRAITASAPSERDKTCNRSPLPNPWCSLVLLAGFHRVKPIPAIQPILLHRSRYISCCLAGSSKAYLTPAGMDPLHVPGYTRSGRTHKH